MIQKKLLPSPGRSFIASNDNNYPMNIGFHDRTKFIQPMLLCDDYNEIRQKIQVTPITIYIPENNHLW